MTKYYLLKKVAGKLKEIIQIIYKETMEREKANRRLEREYDELKLEKDRLWERKIQLHEELDQLQAMLEMTRDEKTKRYRFTFSFSESLFMDLTDRDRRISHVASAITDSAKKIMWTERKRLKKLEEEAIKNQEGCCEERETESERTQEMVPIQP